LSVVSAGGSAGGLAAGSPSRFPEARRIVAIGDLHGDLAATSRVLGLAGAIDEDDHWIGGDLVLVQTGIRPTAATANRRSSIFSCVWGRGRRGGGRVHVLNGNHELLNASLVPS